MNRRMDFIDRLMIKVSPEPNSGCWLWMGSANRGYGTIRQGKKMVYVHRILYELIYGSIPEGLEIDHLCRIRCCVNPQHLETVTSSENHILQCFSTRS